ncbi:N-acetylneuraminate synthase family protein [Pelagibacterales bacterium SAG-MED39]|nr:N-acetylneuraminate synthase family protein [Pelagibacterales bacterium SAG-MED39]
MKIIAEVGWNHLGDINIAKKMIDAAADAGADYCKFQTWSVKNLRTGPWDDDGRRELYKKAELSKEDHVELKNYCKKKNINFLTSIFNIKDINFLKKITPKLIKIGSPEIYNLDLIQGCLKNFDKVILSTGAAEWKEILKLKKLVNINRLTLLHCVSSYPCDLENINMPRMKDLNEISNNIGYSGHYKGIDDALFAICNGAEYIEKHFTIDKDLPGKDNKISIMPNELKFIVNFKNNVIKMQKYKGKEIQDCEKDTLTTRGRWSN